MPATASTAAPATGLAAVSIAEWIGIAGFLLSLCLAINELLRNHMRIRIASPELYPMVGSLDEGYVVFCAIIENRSSLPISLTGLELSFPGLGPETVHFIHPKRTIMSVSTELSRSHQRLLEKLESSPLPAYFSPYESRGIVVMSPCKSTKLREFLRTQFECSCRADAPDTSQLSVRLRMATSRRQKDFDLHVPVCDYENLMKDLEENLRMG